MRRIENHCCDCDSPGYPCRGSLCPLLKVEVIYCDRCDMEIDPDEVFLDDGKDICKDCYGDEDD